jgi:enoyl-[acyl-carrier-protein] reductase (NADH)
VVSQLGQVTAGAGLRMVLHSLAFGTLLPFVPVGAEAISRRQMAMTLDVMAHSLVYWAQGLFSARLLPPGAKVFALTSAGDQKVSANYGAISAAKCALESHVRQLAVELAPHGVAVNALRAGVTVTRSLQRIPEHAVLVERALANNPHGRLTRPEDVAEAVVLLARSDSSWITGNVIGVDGGELLTA